MQVIDLHLYWTCHSSTGSFSQILLKTNYLVCLHRTLAGNGLTCSEIPFTKNVIDLETSQLICILNHLTSFCLRRVLTKNCFWTESIKFINVPKSVSGIDLFSFRYECKLRIFFSPLKCHVRNVKSRTLPFHLL